MQSTTPVLAGVYASADKPSHPLSRSKSGEDRLGTPAQEYGENVLHETPSKEVSADVSQPAQAEISLQPVATDRRSSYLTPITIAAMIYGSKGIGIPIVQSLIAASKPPFANAASAATGPRIRSMPIQLLDTPLG